MAAGDFRSGVKEAMVRALSVPFARGAAPMFVTEFERAAPDQDALKWALGNGLSVVADDAVFESVAGLLRGLAIPLQDFGI